MIAEVKEDKLVKKFKNAAANYKEFPWKDFCTMMGRLGFEMTEDSGSRCSFTHPDINKKIRAHQPHPQPDMRKDAVKDAYKQLDIYGMI